MDFFDFHEVGNAECDACVIPPVACESCGVGLVHMQFDETLEATEGQCDMCLPAVSAVN